jgi:hypothetical protein
MTRGAATWNSSKVLRAVGATCCAALLLVLNHSSIAQSGQTPPNNSQSPSPKGYLLPEANRPLDPNQVMQLREQQKKKHNFAAANAERKRQIDEDAARLLRLAAELRLEMGKTDKDSLSATSIEKADEMERLARSVKEKMKMTIGPG